ncbi:GNAT family N-acetyltransferase [Streptomyces sp. NPDC053493]|uniref:GNAT family N-acetyltransferase n=1 Tax=Streptomyces sp. NPDC053493 TaxID=3365705 RepID=UPI0037D70B4F
MRDDAKLCDGVVTLSPLGPDEATRPGEQTVTVTGAPARPAHREPWRVHGPARTFGIRAGRLVGTVELRPAQAGPAHGDVDVSYALEPEARGRGLATRAVLLACDHAHREGARRAVILAPAADLPAAAVARRAGFTRRGQISHRGGALLDWYVRVLTAG